MRIITPHEEGPRPSDEPETQGRRLFLVSWIAAIGLAALALYLGWSALSRRSPNLLSPASSVSSGGPSAWASGGGPRLALAILPAQVPTASPEAVTRHPDLRTIIPARPRQEVITYTVEKGDSVFGIADQFNLKPESVLWANNATLNDNPDMISVGMVLHIPPADGVLYEWQPGDSLEAVAARFKARAQDILSWPGNNLDLTDPQVAPGVTLMVPGGQREFRTWIIPTIARGHAGVASSVYGAGVCAGGYDGAYGTGAFVWPAANHALSGNDYWPGHLAIDIAAGDGASIFAADAGVVVFAGWANGGYGNTVMIDHGNGYQTLYAHMSSVIARCGASVAQGAAIGVAGSTGNSTGTHLHFEVRYQGGFISPWTVLPAP